MLKKKRKNDLRKSLPHFAVDKVVVSKYWYFPQESCSPKKVCFRKFEKPLESQIKVGELYYFRWSPVLFFCGTPAGAYGDKLLKWLDRTAELKPKEGISRMLRPKQRCYFYRKGLNCLQEKAFMLNVAEGLNSVIQVTESGPKISLAYLNCLLQRWPTERIWYRYEGELIKN